MQTLALKLLPLCEISKICGPAKLEAIAPSIISIFSHESRLQFEVLKYNI